MFHRSNSFSTVTLVSKPSNLFEFLTLSFRFHKISGHSSGSLGTTWSTSQQAKPLFVIFPVTLTVFGVPFPLFCIQGINSFQFCIEFRTCAFVTKRLKTREFLFSCCTGILFVLCTDLLRFLIGSSVWFIGDNARSTRHTEGTSILQFPEPSL
jgi:hypothetical protein